MPEQLIYKKLYAIQQALTVPKNQYNSFGGYKYRSNEDILNALKTYLEDQKLVIIQTDEMINLNNRYYIKATSILRSIEDNSEVSNTAYAREAENKKGMDEAQITGSASSYARKYSLNGLLAIDDTKDADTTNKHGKDDKPKEKAPPYVYVEKDGCINIGQVANIDTILSDKKISLVAFIKSYNKHFKTDIKTINEVIPKNYDEALELLGV